MTFLKKLQVVVLHLFMAIMHIVKKNMHILWFLVRLILSFFQFPFHMAEIRKNFFSMSFLSLPMVALTAIFTGMVLALQTHTGFSRFAAEGALAEVVALSLVRELGPVLTGLMMAGRWGASIAAEIASMAVSDQINALKTMAIRPVNYLITPRVLSGIMAMPLLTIAADIIGILGGLLVSTYVYHANSIQYVAKTYQVLHLSDIYSTCVKSIFFGFIITAVSCYEGYNASGGAYGVGTATTRGVVRSSLLILISNYIITFLFFR